MAINKETVDAQRSLRSPKQLKERAMEWMAGYLDLSLVPLGFILYVGYHLLLFYRTLTLPGTTHFGSEIHQRKRCLQRILQIDVNDREAFLEEMSNNMTLANTSGSYSVTLISVTTISISLRPIIYGDSSAATEAIKYVIVIIFCLVALLCFKVGAKTLGHANFLINMRRPAAQHDYIHGVVVRGFVLIEVGNRSFYFLLALAAWFLGPIPMLAACLMLLAGLYIKDKHTIPLEDSNRHIVLTIE